MSAAPDKCLQRKTAADATCFAAVLAASVALLAPPAGAVDGEILIDQARVNAGGITLGDAPGFPVTLSQSGRYKLTGNLRVPPGQDGIVVTQQNVTIDLNGFTVRGNAKDVLAHSAIGAEDAIGLRVMNGTITGFREFGIYGFNSNPERVGGAVTVENVRILFNGRGVYGEEGRIRNSTIAHNAADGIFCPVCVIEGNVITGNGGDGISASGRALVLGNVIVGNGELGLAVRSPSRAGYGNNILFRNNSGGAQVGALAVQLHPNMCEPACP